MNDKSGTVLLHANCVALDGRGVLLMGRPGVGKSILTTKLIEDGGTLVADDRVICRLQDHEIMAMPPPRLAGLIAIRGLGKFCLPFQQPIVLAAVVKLVVEHDDAILADNRYHDILGRALPCIHIERGDPYAPTRIRVMMRQEPLP